MSHMTDGSVRLTRCIFGRLCNFCHISNDWAAADVFVNRTGEGCASPQVGSTLPHHANLFRVLATSAALYFCHSHVWKVTLLAPRLPLTVTASTNVWFSVSGEKWAERIHRAFPRLFGHGVFCPSCLVYFSFVIYSVTSQIMCWLMVLYCLACPRSLCRWNPVSPHDCRTLGSREGHLESQGVERCLPSFYFRHNLSPRLDLKVQRSRNRRSDCPIRSELAVNVEMKQIPKRRKDFSIFFITAAKDLWLQSAVPQVV